MSEPIYLRRAVITNFRGLSDEVIVDFADRPGVTILVGPNGSGKSTVFDAIEWALTGTSTRLPSLSPDSNKSSPNPFYTLHSDAKPHVALEFGVGSATIYYSSDDGPHAASELLKRSDERWQRLRSVPQALQQTHFSSQRAAMRLAYEEDSGSLTDAFSLSGGLERLEALGNRLWGRDTQIAHRKLLREAESETEQHRQALQSLDKLLALRDREALLDAQNVQSRLLEILARLPSDAPPVDGAVGPEAVERELIQRSTTISVAMSSMRDTADELRNAIAGAMLSSANAEAARETAATADKLFVNRKAALEAARAGEAETTAEVERLNRELADVQTRLEAFSRRDELSKSIAELTASLNDVSARRTSALTRVRDLTKLESLDVRDRAGRRLLSLKKIEASLLEPTDPYEAKAEAERTIEGLSARHQLLADERRRATSDLESEQQRLDAINTFASAIAEQLTHEDLSCPVCAAVYEKGVLALRAAEESQKAWSAELSSRASRLSEITHEFGRIDGTLRLARSSLADAERRRLSLEENRADQARQLDVFGDNWSPASAAEVSQAFEELIAQFALEQEQPIGELLAEAKRGSDELEAIEGMLQGNLGEAIFDRDLTEEQLIEGERAATLSTIRLQLQNALFRAEDRARAARDATTHADAAARDAEAEAGRAKRKLEAALEEAAEADVKRLELSGRFANLTGGRTDTEFLARQRGLAAHYEQALESISNLIGERRAAASTTDVFEQGMAILQKQYRVKLLDDVCELRSSIELRIAECLKVEERIAGLGRNLSVRAKAVREREKSIRLNELDPWNGLFGLVYKILSGTNRESLQFTTSKLDMRRSRVMPRRAPRVDDITLEGWKPVHYFSEGQVAALQISNLVTASVLYPWSRWRALLLDDPLQHADVIKISAFSDLIRSLCADMKHQIVVTTHDDQQADFLAAKFRAANLPVKLQRFERRISASELSAEG